MKLKNLQLMEFTNTRLSNLEKNFSTLEDKIDLVLSLQKNQFIKEKNSNTTLMSSPYNDLSPNDAWSFHQDDLQRLIILDVSSKESSMKKIDGAINIPLESLSHYYVEIKSRTTPIMVISEKGLRSIQACEFLIKRGFHNVNNISGGHEYWPGNKREDQSQIRENRSETPTI